VQAIYWGSEAKCPELVEGQSLILFLNMTTLEIKKYPDPILKQKCQEVEDIDNEVLKLISEMKKIVTEADGAGLAAPQVGVPRRMIVIQTEDGPQAFINPKIISKSKEVETMEEGCLSFPGIRLNIKRAKGVLIEALDTDGKVIQVEAKNIQARIFQHEIDHLDGILFIDRLGFLQRLKMKLPTVANSGVSSLP